MSFKKNDYLYFKEIGTSRLSIRELTLNDVDDIYELFSNENVTRYLGIKTFSQKEDSIDLVKRAISQYQEKQIFYLGILENKSNKIIGYIGLSRYDLSLDTCQIVYALNKAYWGYGYMVEVIKLFNDYLFLVENKKIIIATHIERNINSGKVILRAGMKRDQDYDQEMVIKGKREKLVGYSSKRSNL